MRPATALSDAELTRELAELETSWKTFRANIDEGYGGSPGEWMVERMNELEIEQLRRSR